MDVLQHSLKLYRTNNISPKMEKASPVAEADPISLTVIAVPGCTVALA
jgi:hypothetical protein